MRSLLFVPGDSPRKFDKAQTTQADVLLIDLEDAVAPDQKEAARPQVAALLRRADRTRQKLYVRINAFETGQTEADIAAIIAARPDGVVLPKCRDPDHLARLDLLLDRLERAHGVPVGHTKTMALTAETADSILALPSYRHCGPRFVAMMWGAEDLATSLGALESRRDGVWHAPFQLARNLCLMAAAATGVMAIDTVYTAIEDLDGLHKEALEARRDGFSAKAVIHPSHVEPVNRAFTPSATEIEWARKVIAAFAAAPASGALRMDGKMIDQPHLLAARKIVAQAKLAGVA